MFLGKRTCLFPLPSPCLNPFVKTNLKSPAQEAEALLKNHQHSLKEVLSLLTQQFMIIQNRNQLLLTLSTVTLTITGFSGPTIAKSNLICMILLAIGLLSIIIATTLLLGSGMKLKWITQFEGKDDLSMVTQIIEYRDQKSETYQWQLRLMMFGLCFYTGSILCYFIL